MYACSAELAHATYCFYRTLLDKLVAATADEALQVHDTAAQTIAALRARAPSNEFSTGSITYDNIAKVSATPSQHIR
jgi:hypothetical protein